MIEGAVVISIVMRDPDARVLVAKKAEVAVDTEAAQHLMY